MLRELVAPFETRAPIPGPSEFPGVYPWPPAFRFPADAPDDDALSNALDPQRVAAIGDAIGEAYAPEPMRSDAPLAYRVPWSAASVGPGTVDCVVSQAAL